MSRQASVNVHRQDGLRWNEFINFDPEETARSLAEVRQRVSRETKAQCLWVTPAPVLEDRVSTHWGLSHFGVRFRNEDGLHFTQEGQKRIALEVVRGWADARAR